MCLGGQKQFEGDVFGLRGVLEEFIGVVSVFNDSTKATAFLSWSKSVGCSSERRKEICSNVLLNCLFLNVSWAEIRSSSKLCNSTGCSGCTGCSWVGVWTAVWTGVSVE